MSKYAPYNYFFAATTAKIESNTTVATLTGIDSTYAGAVQAVIQVETAPVRYAYGGYSPGGATGYRADKWAFITLYGSDEMKNFRHIRDGATDCILWVTYKFPPGTHSRDKKA